MNDRALRPSPTSYQALLLMAALVMAAFVLRMVDLERRPLHFDEGINVTFGHRSPADVLSLSRQTFDNDPPGHRFALGLWMAVAGPSPLSIRIFSVFFGILAVAATYRLLRMVRLNFRTAAVAAVLLACAPYAIDYSQQAKGYTMGAAMSALSWLAWVALFSEQTQSTVGLRARGFHRMALVSYSVCTALALSTHYYTLFLLPMQWLWLAGVQQGRVMSWLGRLHRSGWREIASRAGLVPVLRGLLAQGLACIPIGIWLWLMQESLRVSTARSSTKFQPASPVTLIASILREMSAGQFATPTLATIGACVFVALAVVGTVCLWRRDASQTATHRAPARGAFWFGLAMIVPLGGAILIQQRVTFFFPRFLLYSLPNLVTLIAGCALLPLGFTAKGIVEKARPSRAATGWRALLPGRFAVVIRQAPTILAGLILLAGNLSFYQAPIDSANDFRPIVAAARPLIKTGDAALGTYIWMEGMFRSYAPESGARLTWYMDFASPDTVATLMQPIAAQHPRIWSLNFQRDPDAPDNVSVAWLKSNLAYANRFTYGSASLLLFDALSPGSSENPASATHRAVFDGRIGLAYTGVDVKAVQGDTVAVVLQWTALQSLAEEYSVFLHLIAPDGSLLAQNDGGAVNGLAPSFTWTVNHPVVDRRALLITHPLPAGPLALEVGLYRRSSGERLRSDTGEDHVLIGWVRSE